jgi:hypothetical protein
MMKKDGDARDPLDEISVARRTVLTRAAKRQNRRSAHRDGRPRPLDTQRTAQLEIVTYLLAQRIVRRQECTTLAHQHGARASPTRRIKQRTGSVTIDGVARSGAKAGSDETTLAPSRAHGQHLGAHHNGSPKRPTRTTTAPGGPTTTCSTAR